MPYYRKGSIGRRKKGRFKSKEQPVHNTAQLDHSYASVLSPSTASNAEVNSDQQREQWDKAWEKFFIAETSDPWTPHSEMDILTDSDNCSADEFFVLVGSFHQYSGKDNLDDVVKELQCQQKHQNFLQLKQKLITEDLGEFFLVPIKADTINLMQFYTGSASAIKLEVIISSSLTASILVHRKILDNFHEIWTGLPKCLSTTQHVKLLLSKVEQHGVCVGNYEPKFDQHTISPGVSANTSAFREGDFGAFTDDVSYRSTIRSSQCAFLVGKGSERCVECCKYRSTLRKRISRRSLSPASALSSEGSFTHTTHKNMTKTELAKKFEVMKDKTKSVTAELERLKKCVAKHIKTNGMTLTSSETDDLTKMLDDHNDEIAKAFPEENSIQRLFWEQQKRCAHLKDKRSNRWHPMIIKWCLYLRNRSKKAYDVARNSGFINLPSQRTLFDYSHSLSSKLGFNSSVAEHLMREASSLGMLEDDSKSYVGLLQDEVKVSEGLVYDKQSGELVGYVDLEETANDLLQLEERLMDSKPQLATTMLVIMVRGIITNMKYPFAAFATRGITAGFLYPIMWRAVEILENIGLKTLFITCDGATPNRKFFSMHEDPNLGNFYWTLNPFGGERKIYFISDVPHLLKTTRNCFANSGAHKKTRALWKSGKDISWLHILRLYEEQVENSLYCKTFKLTRDHIDLNPYSTMKVNLAAQLFSSSVANALEETYGDSVSETVSFIRHMNRFFDCLNTRSLQEAYVTLNPDKKEFRDPADPRLDYLLKDFLGFLSAWEESVRGRHGNFTVSQRNQMMLSHQTIKGLKISVMSIVECVRFMLSVGANFVLTHRFNQDPLEEQFGQFRQKGGANDNPSVCTVKHMLSEMRIIGSTALQPIRGNITNKRPNVKLERDDTPVPKRPRK